MTVTFTPRTTEPTIGSTGYKYYMTKASGGYNTNPYVSPSAQNSKYKGASGCTALYNCVGYVQGRINEIANQNRFVYTYSNNGGGWWAGAPSAFKRSQTPQLGAIMCWANTVKGGSAGHVAIVEKIINAKTGKLLISESAYTTNGKPFTWHTKTVTSPYKMSGYKFQGFLLHPDLPIDASIVIGKETTTKSTTTTNKQVETALQEYNQKLVTEQQTVANTYTNARGMDLLSSQTLVESPFIIVKIGDYTFGSYTREGTLERENSSMKVTYPNYMESVQINKTNGVLNVYTVNMVYQIIPGKDPNLLDRVLSTVSGSREITLSYGDWETPTFCYREEEAIITKVTSNIDFMNQQIKYTLECTSKALAAQATNYNFPARKAKGSDIIKDVLLKDNHYGLLSVFPGMANKELRDQAGLIASDDKIVSIKAQTGMDPLKYLNYVIASMSANTNDDTSAIKDSTYHLVIVDDIENEFGGTYFKVVKAGTSTKTETSATMYEVDIGVPNSTLVTDFRINTDNSWSILYDYKEKLNTNNYVYSIDSNGNIRSEYVDQSAVSDYYNQPTEINKTWWTKMTQFPITATLTIKGLLRPAILMDKLKINTYFYGQKHISSGVYIITKQVDTINSGGYRTELSLTRISGDDDISNGFTQTNVEKSSATSPTIIDNATGDTTKTRLTIGSTATRLAETKSRLQEINEQKESAAAAEAALLARKTTK